MSNYTSQGSPPQVRGKLPVDLNEIVSKRITPAGAGKTKLHKYLIRVSQDHPRRCGENSASMMAYRVR